jgi:hypothetical protein
MITIRMGEGKEGYDEYEVKSAFETLCKAKEIEQDNELMEEVKKLAEKKTKAISSIADLKQKAAEMDEEDLMEEDEEVEEMPTKEGLKPHPGDDRMLKARDELPPDRPMKGYKEVKQEEIAKGVIPDPEEAREDD